SPLAAAAIVGAASGFTSGAVGTALNGGSLGQVLGSGLINAGIGAVGGLAGGAAAGLASKYIGSVAVNSLNVAGKSAIGGFVSGAIGGGVGGFVGGYATGMLMTGDPGTAWDMAVNGAIAGGIAGGAFGGYKGYRDAKALGNNPWTGSEMSRRNSFKVNPDGVTLPKDAYIPDDFIENPHRPGSYGKMVDGKFVEIIRIDPGTPPGFKGPNRSHFHINGGKEHIFDFNKWPWRL
ncbi:hypothetical protein DFO77_11614, partial [Marinilabilia salmonicolor]